MPDLSGLIGTLLQNPSALASILGLLSGLGGDKEPPCPGNCPSPRPGDCPPPCPGNCPPPRPGDCPPPRPGDCPPPCPGDCPPPCPVPHKKGRCDERRALLMALRPFLSEGRRRAIDSILGVLEILELLENKTGGCG